MWKHFPQYWPFVRVIHQWTKDSTDKRPSNAGLWCFLCCNMEQAVGHTVELPIIWCAMALMWCHIMRIFQPKHYELIFLNNISKVKLQIWSTKLVNKHLPSIPTFVESGLLPVRDFFPKSMDPVNPFCSCFDLTSPSTTVHKSDTRINLFINNSTFLVFLLHLSVFERCIELWEGLTLCMLNYFEKILKCICIFCISSWHRDDPGSWNLPRYKDPFLLYIVESLIYDTKSQNLNVFCLVWQLSLHNPLKPRVKSRMKMQLQQRRQAMLQLHLSDQQIYCLLRWVLH